MEIQINAETSPALIRELLTPEIKLEAADRLETAVKHEKKFGPVSPHTVGKLRNQAFEEAIEAVALRTAQLALGDQYFESREQDQREINKLVWAINRAFEPRFIELEENKNA